MRQVLLQHESALNEYNKFLKTISIFLPPKFIKTKKLGDHHARYMGWLTKSVDLLQHTGRAVLFATTITTGTRLEWASTRYMRNT